MKKWVESGQRAFTTGQPWHRGAQRFDAGVGKNWGCDTSIFTCQIVGNPVVSGNELLQMQEKPRFVVDVGKVCTDLRLKWDPCASFFTQDSSVNTGYHHVGQWYPFWQNLAGLEGESYNTKQDVSFLFPLVHDNVNVDALLGPPFLNHPDAPQVGYYELVNAMNADSFQVPPPNTEFLNPFVPAMSCLVGAGALFLICRAAAERMAKSAQRASDGVKEFTGNAKDRVQSAKNKAMFWRKSPPTEEIPSASEILPKE